MPGTTKPFDRTYFERGGRHALEIRISDFGPDLEKLDLSAYTAIDIGCAEGEITQWLANRFRQVDAIEYMDKCYGTARDRFQDNPNVTVRQCDISTFPLTTEYDFVFFLGVLHFMKTEDLRERTLRHCLEHTRYACFVRTAIHEYHVRDRRNLTHLEDFVTLPTLDRVTDEKFDHHVIDNSYLGDGDRSLGDLVVYRRRCEDNPFPPLCDLALVTQ